MLDLIKAAAIEALDLSEKEVEEARAALWAEYTSDDPRHACRTALEHPEGSTTWFSDASQAAQQKYAKVRKDAQHKISKLLGLILAMEIARERRDEAEKAEEKRRSSELDRRAGGGHKDANAFMARLFKRGVGPSNLHNLSEEEVVVIADLIRWKVHDPRRLDPANPWIEVFGSYACRLLIKAAPAFVDKNVRSVRGTPTRPATKNDRVYYMFGELISGGAKAAKPAATEVRWEESSAAPALIDDEPLKSPTSAIDGDDDPSHSESRFETAPSGSSESNNHPPETPVGCVEATRTADHPAASISAARAEQIAAAVFETNPFKMGIYWPPGIEAGSFDLDRLIPALENYLATGERFSGVSEFLEAARAGRAREFIDKTRQERIEYLAGRLLARDERALAEARKAGFNI